MGRGELTSSHLQSLRQKILVGMYERKLASLVRARSPGGAALPVDLEEIANQWGIAIRDFDGHPEDRASGHFVRRGEGCTIFVNRTRSPPHQRFTLAHELGHFFLEHSSVARDTKAQLASRDPREMAANQFAAELLMPADVVHDAVLLATPSYEMARLFGVSEEDVGYRLRNLGYY